MDAEQRRKKARPDAIKLNPVENVEFTGSKIMTPLLRKDSLFCNFVRSESVRAITVDLFRLEKKCKRVRRFVPLKQ